MKGAMVLGKIRMQERDVPSGKARDSREPIAARFACRIVPANFDPQTCARAARLFCATCARGQ
jgi:hypothetical protein